MNKNPSSQLRPNQQRRGTPQRQTGEKFSPFKPKFILPFMIFMGVMLVGLRVHDIWDSASSGKMFAPVTTLQAASKEETDKKAEEAAEKPADKAAEKPADKVEEKPADKATEKSAEKANEKPAEASKPRRSETTSEDKELSESELLLASKLAERRNQLDKREQELLQREGLIQVAEQRVEQKVKEMEVIRGQLQKLLNQASENQQQQLDNLVKIYETMKPAEAARIFETLDQSVLLGVVQRMKPVRTAAVMAQMNPEKAKDITTALTRQDQLPEIK